MRVVCPANVRLQSFLLQNKTTVKTPCGGRGNCGKCIVRLVKGNLMITTTDRTWLTQEQLEMGYRLACQAFTTEEIEIEIKG